MARHYKSLGSAFYDGMDSRRAQERADGNMIHEDRSAMANLPEQPIMKYYAKPHGYLPEGLNDSIGGVDAQISLDNSKKMRHYSPKKV
jgi:hypothetical protein